MLSCFKYRLEVFGGIDVMEIGAGYIRKEIEDPDYGQITYWEFGGQVHESEPVESVFGNH